MSDSEKIKHIRFKTYWIIQRSVEEGIAYGLNRAHKHEDNPTKDKIAIEI